MSTIDPKVGIKKYYKQICNDLNEHMEVTMNKYFYQSFLISIILLYNNSFVNAVMLEISNTTSSPLFLVKFDGISEIGGVSCENKKDFYTKFINSHALFFHLNAGDTLSISSEKLDTNKAGSFKILSVPTSITADQEPCCKCCYYTCCWWKCFCCMSCFMKDVNTENNFPVNYITINIGNVKKQESNKPTPVRVALVNNDALECANSSAMQTNNITCRTGVVLKDTRASNVNMVNLAIDVNSSVQTNSNLSVTFSLAKTSNNSSPNDSTLSTNSSSKSSPYKPNQTPTSPVNLNLPQLTNEDSNQAWKKRVSILSTHK